MEETSKKDKVIAPPTELPSFLKQKQSEQAAEKSDKSPDKNEDQKKEENQETDSQKLADALTPITEGVKNTVLYSWMKDSFKSSIEIAKDGVTKLVTTLDPQMGTLLNSGGDIEVIVTSANEDKIDSVREAFQDIFRKATVYGKKAPSSEIAVQPVGFEAAELSAKERINALRTNEALLFDKTMLSVENFLVEIYKNQWFDVGLLLLSDVRNNVTLKTFTQFTPIPLEIIQLLHSETPADFDKRSTGLSVTIGNVMAKHLNVAHYDWHNKYTGTARYDMILTAAKCLASIYKRELQSKSSSSSATAPVSEEK